jgi:Protein of unknown function (DUF998)
MLTLFALWSGVAVPFVYYGVQAVAAPFLPSFSILGTTASELGSELSTHPAVFNVGAMLHGIVCLIAAVGFFRALRRLEVHPLLTWPTSIAIACAGLASLWAGYFPLPDPRHGGHPSLLIAMLLIPPLLTATLWRSQARPYLIANLLLLGVMVPIMSGMTGLDTHAYRGICQRVFAFTIFAPIGVAALVLAAKLMGQNPRMTKPPELCTV